MEDKKLIKTALIHYIQRQEERDKPYVTTRGESCPKTYSLNDMLQELENETSFGETFCQNIVNLTMDLLIKGKVKLPETTMNLYKIVVKCLGFKFSYDSIKKYIIAENESELYDLISDKFTYWDEIGIDKIYGMLPNEYLENLELGDEKHTYFEEQKPLILEAWKKYVISTKGEYESEWADYDYGSCAEGNTHYGWEIVKENILPNEIETLKGLGIIE